MLYGKYCSEELLTQKAPFRFLKNPRQMCSAENPGQKRTRLEEFV
jgi:hypothetical protein